MAVREKPFTVEQQAYELVKNRILNMELKPGQSINDVEIAKEMGISRTPVRDALRMLEFEGLITSQARRGWLVSPLSLEDIREIFNIKEALQGMLYAQAASCNDESLRDALREAIEQMAATNESNELEKWHAAHARFHDVLTLMTDYPEGRTNAILSNLNDQWRRVRRGLYAIDGYRQRETYDHVKIAQAVLDGDSRQAELITRQHLKRVREELVYLLENLVFPFASNGI